MEDELFNDLINSLKEVKDRMKSTNAFQFDGSEVGFHILATYCNFQKGMDRFSYLDKFGWTIKFKTDHILYKTEKILEGEGFLLHDNGEVVVVGKDYFEEEDNG
jgi:hypothetical protein